MVVRMITLKGDYEVTSDGNWVVIIDNDALLFGSMVITYEVTVSNPMNQMLIMVGVAAAVVVACCCCIKKRKKKPNA